MMTFTTTENDSFDRDGGRGRVGPLLVGSMRDPASRAQVARLIRAGSPIGIFVRAVCVLFIDGEHPKAAQTIERIKGERRRGRPIGTVLDAVTFLRMLDVASIAPTVREIFLNSQTLASRLGDLCLIRAPITAAAAERLPQAMSSRSPDGTRWLQNWVPFEHEAVLALLEEVRAQGVRYPAVTSMNVSGQPEIVDQTAGIAFCREHGIPLFLRDPRGSSRVRGSFPLIQVDKAGVTLLRDGHFPGYLFSCLLDGAAVDRTKTRAAAYPLVVTHGRAEAGRLPAPQLRREIIARLEQEADREPGRCAPIDRASR